MTMTSSSPGRRAAAAAAAPRQRWRRHRAHPPRPAATTTKDPSSSSSRTSRSSGDADDESSSSVLRRRHLHVREDGFRIRRGGPSGHHRRRRTMITTAAVGGTILLLVVSVLYVYASYLLRVASVLEGRRNRNRNRHRHRRDSKSPAVGVPEGGGGVDDDDHGEPWKFDRGVASEVQRLLVETTGRKSPTMTAYVEPPLPPPVPRRSNGRSNNSSSSVIVPRLPLRTHGPEALRRYPYPRVAGCGTLPASLPVDDYGPIPHNEKDRKRRKSPTFPNRYEYAESHCPVDADPFLPWIHDVFSTSDGMYVEFVAHNKRRCNTDPGVYADDLVNLEPQVTLMQPVPLKRLTEGEAMEMAPDLWRPEGGAGEVGGGKDAVSGGTGTRYRLASYGDADVDATHTRFLCRFHAYVPSPIHDDDGGGNVNVNNDGVGVGVRSVLLGETLSVYPYNYEYANHKKPQHHPMLTGPPDRRDNKNRTDSAHNEQFWNAVLHFRCPVPTNLGGLIASGESVVDDVATIYVDLVPVRTYPRSDELGYLGGANRTKFVPDEEWGRRNVLPLVEVSGRWSNIPVCRPPGGIDDEGEDDAVGGATADAGHHPSDPGDGGVGLRRRRRSDGDGDQPPPREERRHRLVACTWASASFHTRGNDDGGAAADTSTSRRLLEWLTYHLYVADFDHVYVYDNSAAAHSSSSDDDPTTTTPSSLSLEPIVDLFPSDRVTRIDWPFRVCNNNPPASSNPGERSSQYVAETSCRIRYGPHTEWMSFLDVDEYIIPQRGNRYGNSIKRWLMDEDVVGKETNILSFYQTRAKPNVEFMERASRRRGGDRGRDGDGCGGAAFDPPFNAATDDEECPLLTKRPDATYLETYDCDPTPLPKPGWGWRAKKQIYRPRYVLYHHVHYPTVTRRLIDHPDELSLKYNDRKPSERRVDELAEAFMVHAKTTDADSTYGWRDKCRGGGGDACPVGIPWPGVDGTGAGTGTGKGEGGQKEVDGNGMKYNCHRHGAVEDLLPRLRAELAPLIERYTAKRRERGQR